MPIMVVLERQSVAGVPLLVAVFINTGSLAFRSHSFFFLELPLQGMGGAEECLRDRRWVYAADWSEPLHRGNHVGALMSARVANANGRPLQSQSWVARVNVGYREDSCCCRPGFDEFTRS